MGTSPVGTFPPNGYGLLDMTGNTWEWTTDFYAPRHAVPGATGVDAGARANLLGAGEPARPAECSRAGRTSARPITACATAPPRARRSPKTPR